MDSFIYLLDCASHFRRMVNIKDANTVGLTRLLLQIFY